MIEVGRRGFIGGLLALVAAPAIVRAGNLMPVKQMISMADIIQYDGPIFTPPLHVMYGTLKLGDVVTFGGTSNGDRQFLITGFGKSDWEVSPFNA